MADDWSYLQACVWAATRDRVAVRAVRPTHTLLQWEMDGSPVHDSHITTWREHVAVAAGHEAFPTFWEASAQLLLRCQDGAAELRGRKRGKGDPVAIDTRDLCQVEIDDRPCAVIDPLNPAALWWEDLAISRPFVLGLWPDPIASYAPPTTVTPTPKAPAEQTLTRLQQAFVQWRKKHPEMRAQQYEIQRRAFKDETGVDISIRSIQRIASISAAA